MLLPFVAAMAAIPADEVAVGQPFPTLRAEFLTGRTAVLPDAATGKVSLLLLGFSYDSRWAVEAWAERFRHQFGADERVTFFEIPIIGGISKLAKWFIDSGMRKGTPKPGGIIGLLMTVAADLEALWNSVDATMAPLTADLTAAIATADCGQIAAALAKFDAGAKALPAKLTAAISADEAAAVSTALTLIGKQVVP